MLVLGIAAAVGASALYNLAIVLQALEAREVPEQHSLRPSLIGRLARNRRWLGATALGLLGWPLEIVALLLAPLTVVQPCIATGLILLLWLGATRLGERPGRREVAAVAAIIVGVTGVAWASPQRTIEHAGKGALALALLLLAIPIAAPYLARSRHRMGALVIVSAGCAYAGTAIATKMLSDSMVAGSLLAAAVGLAAAAASAGAGTLSEMSALQLRRATHVAPPMLAIQVLVPVVLAPPLFGESWSPTPLGGAALALFIAIALAGTVLLAGSRSVATVIDTAAEGESG